MHHQNSEAARRWVRVGAVSGLAACILYPVAVYVPMPLRPQVIVGGLFGPALAFASFGLAVLLSVNSQSVSALLAALANAMAGALITAMITVQLAIRGGSEQSIGQMANGGWDVVLGLDVSYDIFIGLGTILFGLAMLNHPRFGKIIGIVGIIVGLALLSLNIYTFPQPPGEVGLVDLGPVVGLWYLWVVILAFGSFGWIDRQLGMQEIRA